MPEYNPEIHQRRSIRLHGYDYSSSGVYFLTLCTVDRSCRFGCVVNSAVVLSHVGRIIDETWRWLAEHYSYVELGPHVVVMPNHLHGIIVLVADEGGSRTAPTLDLGGSRMVPTADEGDSRIAPTAAARKPLGRLIGAFKTVSTKRVNELCETPGDVLWQRNYWEHIVRTDDSMAEIADYIVNNPKTWESDKLFVAEGRTL